ncbi:MULTISPECIES: hypothetical protein [Vibrio]|uniref:hypothetical protein n=1 Tax=Vibrio TaxID=662 RepID=UPI001EFC9835|nr:MULTISPECIES: hypothetical protein [Vibrio]MCG9629470.1 hypothetical protein [Vibrio sp. Isolate30]
MPDLYCKTCKKTTHHKSIMKRCEIAPETLSGRMLLLTSKLFSGTQYYDMEVQHFCRTCNCRAEDLPQKENENVAAQVGLA